MNKTKIQQNGWREYKFSEFVDINPPTELKSDEEYSFVEMKDLNENRKKVYSTQKRKLQGGSRFINGDTLFARITPCLENGKICQVSGLTNNKGFGSTEFLIFRERERVSYSDFIYYLSRWREVRDFAELNMGGTSGRQRVSKTAFNELILELPPLPEQKAIAEVLSNLDDKIDLLHRQNKTLEDMAQALFRKWFVEEVKEDWEKIKLSEILDLQGGFVYKTKISGKAISKIAKMGVVNGKDWFNRNSVIDYAETIPEKYKLHEDDLIVCTRDVTQDRVVIGNVAIVPKDLADFGIYAGSNTWIIKTNYNKYFLFLLFRNQDFRNHIIQSSKGSTVVMITRDAFLTREVKMPSPSYIENFNTNIRPFFERIKNNLKQIRTLENLRDTLLPKLMSGEVRVRYN